MQLWTTECRCLFKILISLTLYKFPEVERLDHVAVLLLVLWGISMLLSIVPVPIYILTDSTQVFPFPQILAKTCNLDFVIILILRAVSWYLMIVLIFLFPHDDCYWVPFHMPAHYFIWKHLFRSPIHFLIWFKHIFILICLPQVHFTVKAMPFCHVTLSFLCFQNMFIFLTALSLLCLVHWTHVDTT